MRSFGRLVGLLVVSLLALQLFFAARIALMAVVDPQSTTFQRSEMWRLLTEQGQIAWAQEWVPDERISHHLKRAVIASEDATFTDHGGVDWDALEKAWEKNQKAEARADKLNLREEQKQAKKPAATPARRAEPKVIGGSTITQQLAKNLFLAGERSLARKGQEIVITFMLEAVLSKQRILEIYLNNVEWGEGVFGAEAAARHYFRVPASALGTYQAARLAVMLPAPKRFEKRPGSPYVLGRAATIQARMGAVELP
ncbi:transglycosylase domain-containing protein [Piscinibacter gummiphilus]|uniref:Biosynthetic peptidoglycan transglycosylase n=1 Tax=Piscinibacter gummiphilus TaxID=946333 RepID=A0A1W6LEN9_9BURK|nr:transglycosylase domain-containing protein [Piscinibacter gummiphilus]ARN22732.1 monofunctional biosynthetic peptidoglycan transglycosylase [Piscinibacter gummiphilus]ATU67429.1 monofunctional biosynthetic peptidoglycan transglycosylase [Piscinibacter gummiphilus]GLS97788.1 monofunctional biosynthetic peptidoglycan transglycosylase [Piscinibacter gummiphilus]